MEIRAETGLTASAGRLVQQVPGEARLRPGQARRADRDPAGRRWLSSPACRSSASTGSGPATARAAAGAGYPDRADLQAMDEAAAGRALRARRRLFLAPRPRPTTIGPWCRTAPRRRSASRRPSSTDLRRCAAAGAGTAASAIELARAPDARQLRRAHLDLEDKIRGLPHPDAADDPPGGLRQRRSDQTAAAQLLTGRRLRCSR